MSGIILKNKEEIEKIRAACNVVVTILDELNQVIKPGITTDAINNFCHARMTELGATPSPLGYEGYPKAVCTSINDVICHGVPSEQEILRTGDIINVDVTCCKDGFHGDSCRMYYVGGKDACSQDAITLIDTTRKAMWIGIAAVKPGAYFGDIGFAIEQFIKSTGFEYGIVRSYTGHGIGRSFHELPQVMHYGKAKSGPIIKPGMTFTVEPMINQFSWKAQVSKKDGWTAKTIDGGLSAQWEHTVAVTDTGVDVLTLASWETLWE